MKQTTDHLAHFFLQFNPFLPKIPVQLKLQPGFRGRFKKSSQSQGCFSGDASLPTADFLDGRCRDSRLLSQFTSGQIHGLQKFFLQNFSRMGGFFDTWSWQFHSRNPFPNRFFDGLEGCSFLFELEPSLPKIIRHLHIKPELWSILKNICQFKGHHRRNSSFVPTNFINDPWGAAHLFSQSGLGHVEGNQELFLQYGARFCGFNIMWFFHKRSSVSDFFRQPAGGGPLKQKRLDLLPFASPNHLYHYTTQWNQKRRWSLKFLLTPILLAGCVSRAPTQCELDRRSGLYPNSYCEGESHPLPGVSRDLEPDVPARTPAVIKKVWVSDQMIEGGHWMQGTWVYLEVEPSRWQGAFKVRQRPSLQGLYSNQSHIEQTKKGEKAGPNPRFKEVGP